METGSLTAITIFAHSVSLAVKNYIDSTRIKYYLVCSRVM
jgi:hypothetical protein